MKTPEERLNDLEEREQEKKELFSFCFYYIVGALAFVLIVLCACNLIQITDLLKKILEILQK